MYVYFPQNKSQPFWLINKLFVFAITDRTDGCGLCMALANQIRDPAVGGARFVAAFVAPTIESGPYHLQSEGWSHTH